MKSLLKKLEEGIKKLENGSISSLEMDELVQTAREVQEKLLVVRFKLYEQQIFPERIHTPVDLVLDSLSSENTTEIEKPIDLNLEETEGEEATSTDIAEDLIVDEEIEQPVEYKPNPRELIIDTVVQKPIETQGVVELSFEDEAQDSVDEKIASSEDEEDQAPSKNDEQMEESTDELIEEPSSETQMDEDSQQSEESASTLDLTKDEPAEATNSVTSAKEMEFKSLEKVIAANTSLEKLETLIGSFTLNDKLLFINSLFDGSSDAFAKAVKLLDATSTMSEARGILITYAEDLHWEMDNEVVEDFVERICQRHADKLDQ